MDGGSGGNLGYVEEMDKFWVFKNGIKDALKIKNIIMSNVMYIYFKY